MLTQRIIACLDVRDGKVVKGTRFKNHQEMGEILDLTLRYRDDGVDELVFYDVSASSESRRVCRNWVAQVAKVLNIPFCVAGGIRSVRDAAEILSAGADKISINTPALENPNLISELVEIFGQQCVVVGVDSLWVDGDYEVCSHTGNESTLRHTKRKTLSWLREIEDRGAGEVVLNCMDRDGTGEGFDLRQLSLARQSLTIPLVASGGAKNVDHFEQVFKESKVNAALGARAFHDGSLVISELKKQLLRRDVRVRL